MYSNCFFVLFWCQCSGLEHLCALEELDVGYNCISKHNALLPLSSLPNLYDLRLDFNPISFGKEYRIVVVQRCCTAVNKKKVNNAEYYLIYDLQFSNLMLTTISFGRF